MQCLALIINNLDFNPFQRRKKFIPILIFLKIIESFDTFNFSNT